MYKQRQLWMVVAVCLSLFSFALSAQAQNQPPAITLSVNAGYDGSFRENQWMPVYIRIRNDGDPITGRVVVRPETSNGAVNNTYSLPIELEKGARKAVFLYITALGFANQLRVEFINTEGVVVAAEPANVRSIQTRDQLHIVVSQSAAGSIDLTGVHDDGYNAFQANWGIENLPDQAVALTSVDTMLFSDVDTGGLSAGQRGAIKDWVAQGGHLVVTGGANWQGTAAGLTELLPFAPAGSTSVDTLNTLMEWMRLKDTDLGQQTVLATGAVKPDSVTMVNATKDLPLLVRGTFGGGVVDYMTADPNTQPLRGWGSLTTLWLTLATSVNPQPGWAYGVNNWEQAVGAVNVMPGINLLPDILPLCGFLAVYIALIGPLNYLVLNRINRREYAWVTIPIFILVFSVLAWVVGFNLRGNEVTTSRLAVVQSWPDHERAYIQEFVGLLSPRRAQYSLSPSDNGFLRPIPRASQGGLLNNNVQTSTEIQQTDKFRAANFPVDASFIASFTASAFSTRPDITGQATLFYDGLQGQQTLRGSVRNSTSITLKDPVILVRGQALRLNKALAPGEIRTFDLTLPGEGLPSPAPLAYAPSGFTPLYYRSYSYYQNLIPQTLKDILGEPTNPGRRNFYLRDVGNTPAEQETYRRLLLLQAVVSDAYNVLTGRGNHAYLAAWGDNAPLEMNLEGASWKSLDSTLYLIQLDVNLTPPGRDVLVTADQFTWTVRQRSTLNDIGPLDISLQPNDEVVFQFTPLPDAVLKDVGELTVAVDRGSSSNRTVPLQIRNWDTGEWEDIQVSSGNSVPISDPQRFLGPHNAVQLRLDANSIGGYPRLQDLSVEQRGRF